MPDVLTEQRGTAFWITINREERRNAINPDVIFGIRDGIRAALETEGVRAIVLTGAGDKAFCAGGDLKRGTGNFTMGLDQPQTDFGLLARTVRECWLPIVARVNGACVAGGMGLMALADLAVAADHARFGLPEARVGVFPMQVLVYLRQLVGVRHLNELCLTGALIDAPRAREIGLVNQVVPAAELDDATGRLLGSLAQMSPVALRRGKHAIAVMETMPFEQALSYAEAQIGLASRTDDAEEGLAAFNEKRPARWVPTDE